MCATRRLRADITADAAARANAGERGACTGASHARGICALRACLCSSMHGVYPRYENISGARALPARVDGVVGCMRRDTGVGGTKKAAGGYVELASVRVCDEKGRAAPRTQDGFVLSGSCAASHKAPAKHVCGACGAFCDSSPRRIHLRCAKHYHALLGHRSRVCAPRSIAGLR